MKHYTGLALSSGGILGIGFIGGLQRLHEEGILSSITRFAGSSAGGMIALCVVIGYTPEELLQELLSIEFSTLLDNNQTPLSLIDGRLMNSYMYNIINNKIDPYTTFIELYEKTGKDLFITGTALNKEPAKAIFSYKTTPTMPLMTAMSITGAIPTLLPPIEYEEALYLDGGILNPMASGILEEPTLCLSFDTDYGYPKTIVDVIRIVLSLMTKAIGSMNSHDTITFKTEHDNTIDFSIDNTTKLKLYKTGYDAVTKFFSSSQTD